MTATTQQQFWSWPNTVESVVSSRTNGPLIATAAVLWIHDTDEVLDTTYGRGNFWTHYRPADLTCHDLAIDGVDFRALPEDDESCDVVVFDPPYIVRGGVASSTRPEFFERFGLGIEDVATLAGLKNLMADGMAECVRVLRSEGRLFVKCMDLISSGKYQQMRHFVVETAHQLELEQVDEFVHYSGTGPGNKRPVNEQQHSRRAHSFLCVFRKTQGGPI